VSGATHSDGDPDATGTPADGSGGAPDGTGDASPGAVDADEKRRRDLQSQLDRERAKSARLEAELRAASSDPDGTPAAGVVDEAQVGRMVAATIARETAKADLARSARERYPHADPQLLADLSAFRSPEELELALARSHELRSNDVRAITESVEQEVRARLGNVQPPPDGSGPPPSAGDELTVGAVEGMGLEALLDPKLDEPLRNLSHRLVTD